MANDILSKKGRIGILFQDKTSNHWNNPQLASANFISMEFMADSPIPDPDVQVDQFEVTGAQGIYAEASRRYVDGTSGLPVIPFSGWANKETLTILLTLAYQGVTEGATTPYTKVFDGDNTIIDFPDNEGHLATIAVDFGISAEGERLQNAIVNTLTLSNDLNARGVDRLFKVEGEFIGTKLEYNQNFTGTWTSPTNTKISGFEGNLDVEINLDAIEGVCHSSSSITISNNVFSDCKTTDGQANNLKREPEITFEFNIPMNSSTVEWLDDYKAGNSVIVTYDNGGDGTADGKIRFEFTEGVLTANPHQKENGYERLVLAGRCELDSSGNICKCTFSDAIDWAL